MRGPKLLDYLGLGFWKPTTECGPLLTSHAFWVGSEEESHEVLSHVPAQAHVISHDLSSLEYLQSTPSFKVFLLSIFFFFRDRVVTIDRHSGERCKWHSGILNTWFIDTSTGTPGEHFPMSSSPWNLSLRLEKHGVLQQDSQNAP